MQQMWAAPTLCSLHCFPSQENLQQCLVGSALKLCKEMPSPLDPACSSFVLGRRRRLVYIRGRKTNIVKLYPRQSDRPTDGGDGGDCAAIVRPVCFALPAAGRVEKRLAPSVSLPRLESAEGRRWGDRRGMNFKPNHLAC